MPFGQQPSKLPRINPTARRNYSLKHQTWKVYFFASSAMSGAVMVGALLSASASAGFALTKFFAKRFVESVA